VVVEGYKRHSHPKLEVYRAAVGKPLLHPDDNCIVALASDAEVPGARVPVLDLADEEKIADVLLVESVPIDRIGAEVEEV
jgi:molybdopterin-guanine dinucleotide biosynthesis adapter protein